MHILKVIKLKIHKNRIQTPHYYNNHYNTVFEERHSKSDSQYIFLYIYSVWIQNGCKTASFPAMVL